MSLEFNADKQELRSSNLKIASSDDLTVRSGAGTDEKEIMRFLIDPTSKLPRVGVNRTGRRLESIVVDTTGSGYTSVPDIIISAPDDPILGVQATATATVLGEAVSSISVDNPGFGYTTPPTITVSGGGGAGASATAALDTVDYELDVNGAIRTSTSIISDTARILNLDIENFVTPDINFRAPDLKIFSNAAGSIWEASTTYPKDTYLYFADNVYRVENTGRTGTTAPLFKDGSDVNGEVTLKHIGYRVDDQEKPFYGETVYPRSVTPPLGDRSDRIATTEYVLNLATNDVGGRVYVSQEIGDDANTGRSAATPVRTIKRACQIATETIGVKETVIISGGDYSEDNPISIPPDCSVVGDNLRLVIIRPKNPRKHMFKFADKNYISGIVFRDKLDSEGRADETWDFAVAFDDKQRLYYEPTAGGDFERNFPIGHQIFGKQKYRITFQDHTGIEVVGGEPVSSFLTIGATVQGVNSSAIGTVIGITYDSTEAPDGYTTGTVDIEVVSGSFNFADIYQYDVGTDPNITTYEFVSNDLRSIRSEGEVVFHGTEPGIPISITRIDGSLQGDPSIATGGFGGDDDLGGIVFYTNPITGRANTHDFKEGSEVLISGLVGNLAELNGVQRIYKVIEDADGRARRFVIPKKLPSFTDSNFIPIAVNVQGYSNYVLVSLLNSPNNFEATPPLGRRWQDATNLIKNNVEFIKDETYLKVTDEFDGINFTTFTQPDPAKCRRDIGHFVYAIIQDLQFGSNFNVIEAAKRYVQGTQVGYIGNEITETVRAFEIAKDLCKLAVRNWHTGTGAYSEPQYTPEYSALSYYTDTTVIEDTTPTPGPNTCADVVAAVDTLGYLFVDVITNNAADRYLDAAELIARNEELILEETIGLVSTQYPDFYIPDDNVNPEGHRFKDGRNLIYANFTEIVDTAYDEIAIVHPTFVNPDPVKCKRDIGYVVRATANDLYNGGNSNIVLATKYYFDGSGNPISNGLVGEEAESITAFNKARDLMKQAVANQLTVTDLTVIEGPATYGGLGGDVSRTNSGACADVQSAIDTLVGVITDAVSNGNLTNLPTVNYGDYVAGENVCKRDIGYILQSLRRDMTLGGNSGMVTSAEAYFTGGVLTGISQPELPVTRYAFEKVRDLCILAVRNWHTGTGAYSEPVYEPQYSILPLYTDSTVTEDTTTPTCADVVSTITTSFQTLDDILAGGVPPAKTYGTLYNTDSIENVPELTMYDADLKRVNILSTYMDLPIIEASPYIQNASVISFKGGGGCEIDGSKVKQPNCPFPGLDANGNAETPNQGKSMVAAQFTIVSFNGTGYKIVNDGYTQLVSVFVLFAKDGVVAESGGYASITNSATNFGIYALRATGYREEAYSFDIGTVESTNITPNGSTILRVGGLGREPLEHYVVKFADFENQDPNIEYFVDTVSQVTVGPPFTASLALNAPILIQDKATQTPVLNVDDATMVGTQVRLHRPSIVNSSSHTWEYAGSGTDYNALPENGGTKIDGYEQVSENYGRVYVSGTDELGDFKVGTFAKIENRTGNITFTGTVSISEVEFLKLKGGDVVVTGFSAANDLGGAFASNSLISTQKAVKDYIGNNLGPYLNKPYSTSAVPRALVELTDSGKISLDQIPAIRPFSIYTVADEAERLALEGPLAGDIAIQGDTNKSYILENDLTSSYLGINVDPTLVFNNGELVTGDVTGGIQQVTDYVEGIVYEIQIVDGGSGYTSAPTVSIAAPASGTTATATATIADGKVILITITENGGYKGGQGYTTAPSISFSAPGAGGTTASANALIESRVYADIVNNIKIEDTDAIEDHAPTPNTVNILRVVNTSASVDTNWVSLSTTSVAVNNLNGPGQISPTLLGTGAASSFTFLAGDQTYKPVTQTIKALENRYFLKTISASNTPSQQLVFQADSQLLIGHGLVGSYFAEDTTIAQIVVSEGEATVTLSTPIQTSVPSGAVIEFTRPESPLVFDASNVKVNYIDRIVIANPGNGYTDGEYFGVDVSSGGVGTDCFANIVVTNGGVTSAIVTDGGSNFTDDYTISPNPTILGTGNGLVLQAKVANSVKNSGIIGMDIRRVDDKTLDADPYGNAGIVRFLKSDTATGRIGQFRFVSGGGVYIDQGPDSNFDADKLDGQHGNYYLDGQYFIDSSIGPAKLGSGTFNISISGQSGNTIRLNTQTLNSGNSGLPNTFNEGITSAWKTNLSDGLTDPYRPDDPDSGYHGVITFRQFGESNDDTGGGVRQLAFTDKNNLWLRGSGAGVATWSDWKVIWSAANHGSGSGLDADILDGRQGTWYQNGRNINFGRIGASHMPELFDNTHIYETLSVKNYSGNSIFDVYVSGQVLNTFPFQINETINLYDSDSQGVGTVYVLDVITDDTNTDPTEHYTILRVRLDNGGFGASGAIRIGTASINVPFDDFTPATLTTYELASLTGSGGQAALTLGASGVSGSPEILFRSSGNDNAYDVSLVATGGGATGNDGQGALNINAFGPDSLTLNNNVIWNEGNVTFEVGLSGGTYNSGVANGTAVIRDGSGNFAANNITASLTGAASLNVLKSGDTMTGNLTVGSTSTGSTRFVRVLTNDSNRAGFEAYGNNQGTGYLYVGQSGSYGGGLAYNGDGSPAFASGELNDNIAFYRKDNGNNTVVFQYPYNSNTVTFTGRVNAPEGVFNGGSGNAANDATLYVTASNNNDWGLVVDKYNGSANEYGVRIDVGSGATYALRVRGNDAETFRVNGAGAIFGTQLSLGSGDIASARNVSLTGSISLTGNSTRITQNSTSTWSGDAGSGFGKLEYHSNRWYINAGSNSTEVVRFRRGGSNVGYIDNSGNLYLGSSNTATLTAGVARLTGNSDGIMMTGSAPTITFRDTNHRTGYIHVNSNRLYVLCGATNAGTGSWSVVANGRWPAYWDLTNNNMVCGGNIDANTGNVYARSFRTPAASFGSGSLGNNANNNNYVLYANNDRQWLDTYGVVKSNRQSINENLTIPTSMNACSYGPITVNSGRTIYIGNGATWTVL